MMRLRHVSKSFGANHAVDDVSLDFAAGEIVGLVGENGAGKTTLMRIVAGELTADGGTIDVDPRSVGFVHQHFLLVNQFTIAENLALAVDLPPDEAIARSGIELRDPNRRVAELSVGEKAKLELIKAIARRPKVLILDEPTSVLAPSEARELFAVMRTLAAGGTIVVFISHKIPEVLEVATRIAVMRRGKLVATGSGMSAQDLAEAMVGRLVIPSVARDPAGRAGAENDDLRSHSVPQVPRYARDDIAKPIVAIIGVAGNGQTELAQRLRDDLGRRAANIPEDRTRDGLVAEMSIAENIALRERRWNRRDAMARAARLIDLFNIRAQSPRQLAGSLSGGNQQKVILARELERNPDVIVAAEPTRGLDIEAARFVHDKLRAAAARGAEITLITSDLDEAFAVGDVIKVIYRGKLSDAMTPAEAEVRAPALMAGVMTVLGSSGSSGSSEDPAPGTPPRNRGTEGPRGTDG